MNKKILAVVLIVLIISLCVVSIFAISPPALGSTVAFSSPPSLEQAHQALDTAIYQYRMTTFNSYRPVLLAYRSTEVRLYVVKEGFDYSISNDGSNFTISYTASSAAYAYGYFVLSNGGFSSFFVTTTLSFPVSTVIGFSSDSSILVFNDSYVGGDVSFSLISDNYLAWSSYYDKVWNYDQNISDAEAQGRADGYEDGYSAGYEIGDSNGYADGYEEGQTAGYNSGYSDGQTAGYNSGYAAGQEFGEEIGYDEGYQEGYEGGVYAGQAQGYETGFDDGYETGYDAGYDIGHQIGSFEGFETGLNEGFNQGYDIGFEEGYETGFVDGQAAGGGSDPTYTINCAFLLAGDTDMFYFYWDGSDPSSLRTDPLNEQPEGYVLYTVSETFTSDQWRAPSSINLSVPALIQERYGFHFARYYDRDLNFLYFQVYVSDYNIGFQDGADILDGIGSIAAAPVNGLASVLDFDVFGVNVKAVIIGILSILVALLAWRIIKKFVPV